MSKVTKTVRKRKANDNTNPPGTSAPQPPTKSKKNNKVGEQKCFDKFTNDEKIHLASLIEKYPCLWRSSCKEFQSPDCRNAAWESISEVLNHPKLDCQGCWGSLRDKLRYRKSKVTKKPKGKSGDAAPQFDSENVEPGDDPSLPDEEAELTNWIFYDAMKFVVNEQPKRKTASSHPEMNKESEPNQSEESFILDEETGELIVIPPATGETVTINTPGGSATSQEETVTVTLPAQTQVATSQLHTPKSSYSKGSSYDYMQKPVSKGAKDAERIADAIEKLCEAGASDEDKLQYYSMYLNMDRMLKKLPELTVEKLNCKFTSLIFEEIEKMDN